MPTPCNVRYRHLKQLEAEFASMKESADTPRLKQLASEIVELRQEFGGRHLESERMLNGEAE
jgi:hypothetical protein